MHSEKNVGRTQARTGPRHTIQNQSEAFNIDK